MTHYIYKGKEILHLQFIALCQRNGISGGHKQTYYEKLVEMAEKGDERAKRIMSELKVIK